MWPTIVFGGFLILLSLGLLVSHLAARRTHEAAAMESAERNYRREQYRRRMLTSALIGLVGIAVLAGTWVNRPPYEALYWCGVLLATLWILSLAWGDVASTRSFFRGVQRRRAEEHAAIQEEIERFRRHKDNGRGE